MNMQDEVQFNDYEEWLAAAKAAHPAARHNKQGLPGWVRGYGEAHDEEFVTGPDMQITGTDFFNQNNLADITVISDYGLTKADENIIRSAPKWPRR